jgi:hypothetical protein
MGFLLAKAQEGTSFLINDTTSQKDVTQMISFASLFEKRETIRYLFSEILRKNIPSACFRDIADKPKA